MSNEKLMIPKSDVGDFVPIEPAAIGAHHGVCCEVYDRGLIENKKYHKMEHRLWFVFRVNEKIEGTDSEFDGKWKEVRINVNAKMNPKTRLWGMLEEWRGTPLTDDDFEADGQFNAKRCEGGPATIIIGSWSEPDEKGRQWPNDVKVLPPVYEPEDAKRLRIKIDGINEMSCDGYVTIDERKKESTDFPLKEAPKSSASSSKKPPAPF